MLQFTEDLLNFVIFNQFVQQNSIMIPLIWAHPVENTSVEAKALDSGYPWRVHTFR